MKLGTLLAAGPSQGLVRAARKELADITRFSNLVLGLPLRPYQREPLRAILTSILEGQGREFLLIFPRQSGKNEAVAQLLAYLLNIYQRSGGNVVYGAQGTGLALGIERLEDRLTNAWNRGTWRKRAKPERRRSLRPGPRRRHHRRPDPRCGSLPRILSPLEAQGQPRRSPRPG